MVSGPSRRGPDHATAQCDHDQAHHEEDDADYQEPLESRQPGLHADDRRDGVLKLAYGAPYERLRLGTESDGIPSHKAEKTS